MLALALSFNVIPQVYAKDATIPPEVLQQQNEILENTLKNILAHFNALDLILQDLQMIVSNDQVGYVKNKREMVEEIKNIRLLLENVQKDSFTELNPGHICLLNKILDALVEHIGSSLNAGFTTMPAFDIEGTVKRALNSEVDLNDLDQYVETSRKKIEGLSEQAKSAGLVWYNKIYRKIDDYVIQPSIRHSVPQRAGKILLGVAILTTFWFNTDRGTTEEDLPLCLKQGGNPSKDEDYIPYSEKYPLKDGEQRWYKWEYWLRNLLGAYPHVNSHGDLRNTYLDDFHRGGRNQLQWAGIMQMKMIDFARGNMPMFAYLFGLAPIVYRDELSNAYDWAAKKAYALHNFLRGGAYRNLKFEDQSYQSMSTEPKVTFKDLVGLDHPKDVLSMIVRYIEDPERWDRGNLKPEKGYLLTGPTRTGKSYIAEALAGEIRAILKRQNRNPEEFGFYVIKASFIIKNGIAQVLEAARREAPCVLFIDEIDLLGLQRAGGNRDLLNEFLLSMSGTLENDPKRQVIILAATNKPENLDEALKQRGRFGKEIRFEYPNYRDRREMLKRRLSSLVVNIDSFDLDKLTLETEGCSFEDLNAIVKGAFQKSKIHGVSVTQKDLEEALDIEVRNIIMCDTKNLPAKERELLAIHQAGHALVASLLPSTQRLAKVTIRPVQPKLKEEAVWDAYYKEDNEKQKTIEHGKMFTYHPEDTLNFNSRTEKINSMKIQLAGHAAEEVLLGSCGYSYHIEDNERALNIAKSIVFEGIKVDKLPKKLQNDLFDSAFKLLTQCKKEVAQLLETNKDKLKAVVEALKSKMTLSAADVMSIIETGKLPETQKPNNNTQAPMVDAQVIAKELGIQEVSPQAKTTDKSPAPAVSNAQNTKANISGAAEESKAILSKMIADDAADQAGAAAAA